MKAKLMLVCDQIFDFLTRRSEDLLAIMLISVADKSFEVRRNPTKDSNQFKISVYRIEYSYSVDESQVNVALFEGKDLIYSRTADKSGYKTVFYGGYYPFLLTGLVPVFFIFFPF